MATGIDIISDTTGLKIVQALQAVETGDNAKSYAVGGTGTREGEDTDNAKYYADLAKQYEEAASKMDVGTLTKLVESIEKVEETMNTNLTAVNHSQDVYPAFVVDRLADVGNLDECTTNGIYQFAAGAIDSPIEGAGMMLVLNSVGSGVSGVVAQYAWSVDDAHTIYCRIENNGTMGAWSKITSEVETELNNMPQIRKLETQTIDISNYDDVATLTWISPYIGDTSMIDVYASIPNVAPTDISQTGNSVTVTFDTPDENMDVGLIVYN